jgi:eukaryotic-like serine/threonine-protein kinase
MQPLRPGDPEMIGTYRITGRLGAGGMGVVYLAQSPSGRRVAVKVIRGDLAGDVDFRSRFRREVAAARGVHSAYTAPVIDADTEADHPWLATVFVPGPALSERVSSAGPLQAAEAWALGAGLAEALGAIHASGVVHRDLKPANVILAEDGPRVIDFGIARAAAGTVVTRTGVLVGSPNYMAPEYVRGDEAGPAADVFALAGTVAYAVTGQPPYGEGAAEVVLMRLLHEQPDLSDVDAQLAAVLRLAMQQDPQARPDALSLLSIFADGANRRGATMSYPRSYPIGGTATTAVPGYLTAVGPAPTADPVYGPDRRPARLAASALILLICLIAGVAAYLVARAA